LKDKTQTVSQTEIELFDGSLQREIEGELLNFQLVCGLERLKLFVFFQGINKNWVSTLCMNEQLVDKWPPRKGLQLG